MTKKYQGKNKNFLIKNKNENRFVTDSSIIANTFDNYFINITNNLNLKLSMQKSTSLTDLLKLHEDNFSVLKIKEKYKYKVSSFIPLKHVTESVDIYDLTYIFNMYFSYRYYRPVPQKCHIS